ncbi:MAG: hypothetical protein Q9169_007154 [Polycauliona sp. 2 TL-2023]
MQEKSEAVERQISEAHAIQELFRIPFHIIGQLPAAEQIINVVVNYFAMNSAEPLVLLFAGASGHGKTELASRMGDLLCLDIMKIDCMEMKHETDLFGAKAPYHGYKNGSPLNKISGQAFWVSTESDVRDAMFVLLDSGEYRKRIDGKELDCSETIWILATNYGEEQIREFWDKNLRDVSEERQLSAPFDIVEKELETSLIQNISAPVTGRLTAIVPSLHFTPDEQAVVAYTFLRRLHNDVRADVDEGAKIFAGHMHLRFLDDGQISQYLARAGCNSELGARSLRMTVNRKVGQALGSTMRRGEYCNRRRWNESLSDTY